MTIRFAGLSICAGLLLSSCNAQVLTGDLTEACLSRLADDALGDPNLFPLPANFAGPLGLTSSSDPESPAYHSRQVGAQLPSGEMRALGVDAPDWVKALMMNAVPEPNARQPTVYLYVIDRAANLLSAGVIRNQVFTPLDPTDPDVVRAFREQRSFWAGVSRC